MIGVPPLRSLLVIQYDLIRHLRLQPSEVLAMPVPVRNYTHRQICKEIEEHNRHVQEQLDKQKSK